MEGFIRVCALAVASDGALQKFHGRPLQGWRPEGKTTEYYGRLFKHYKPMRTNPKILLVEDDKVLAESLQRALEGHYAVETADRAKNGLAAAMEEDFDAVVTDLQMPGGQRAGLEVLENLHITKPHLPV